MNGLYQESHEELEARLQLAERTITRQIATIGEHETALLSQASKLGASTTTCAIQATEIARLRRALDAAERDARQLRGQRCTHETYSSAY